MKTSLQNLWEKEEIGFWLLSPKTNSLVFLLLLLILPTQLGLHFWPDFSYVSGTRVDYLSPTLYLTDVLFIILFILNLTVFSKIIQFLSANKKITLVITIFVSLNIASSSSPLSAVYYLVKIFEMTFFSTCCLINFRSIRNLIVPIFSVGILFESLLSTFQFIKQGSLNGVFYLLGERFYTSSTPNIANASLGGELVLRPYGTFSHPNVLASYILITTFFMLNEVSFKKDLKSFFYLACIVLGFITLLLTLSRVAIVLYLILIGFGVFKSKFDYKKMIILLFSLVLTASIFAHNLYYRFYSLFSSDPALSERWELFKASLRMFWDNLFLGVGLGNFLHVLPNYYKGESYFFLQPVHNIFLLFGSETGLFGLLGLTVLFIFLFRKTKGFNRIFWIILLILGLFDHFFLTIQQGQLLFAFSISYLFSYANREGLI